MGKKHREEPKPPPETAQERLLKALEGSDPGARAAAARGIAEGKGWESPSSVSEALARRLVDESSEVRAAALQALGSLGEDATSSSVEAMVKAMERHEDLVSPGAAAIRRIGEDGVETAANFLLSAFLDEDDRKGVTAAAALLIRLGPGGERFLNSDQMESARGIMMTTFGAVHREDRPVVVDAMLGLGYPPQDLLELVEDCAWSEEEKAEVRNRAMRDTGEETAGVAPGAAGAAGTSGAPPIGPVERIFLYTLGAIPILAAAGAAVTMTVLLGPMYPVAAVGAWSAGFVIAAFVALWWWHCPACGKFFAGKRVHSVSHSYTTTESVRTASGGSANVQVTRSHVTRWYRCRNCGHVFKR